MNDAALAHLIRYGSKSEHNQQVIKNHLQFQKDHMFSGGSCYAADEARKKFNYLAAEYMNRYGKDA